MTLAELELIGADLPSMVATIGGARHQDYTRVTELRELYIKLISGKDINSLLVQFTRREDKALFEQRCAITQAITPAVASQLAAPFYKVTRVNNITEVIDFPGTEGFEDKRNRVITARNKYNGDSSLDDYMDTRFVELSFYDPNAFIVTDFYDGQRDELGNLVSPVVPFPHEVSCFDAVNFRYVNNSLLWLVVANGNRFIMYMADNAVSFTKVSSELYASVSIGQYREIITVDGTIVVYRHNEKDSYIVDVFNHKSSRIPAKRIGYKRDLQTEGRTYVSPLHDALPYFMKSIKTVSEFDLTMALHAFPQKLAQSPKCLGTGNDTCHNGQTPNGSVCGSCHGTGIQPISTTAGDAITVPMGRDANDTIQLDNLVKYVQFPVEVVELQYKVMNELSDKAREAMYNSDVFNRSAVVATATEKKLSMESVYDVLMPFAKQYSAMWKHQMIVCANYVDSQNIIIEHIFPKDFGFRTRDELIGQIAQASESAAPPYVKEALSRELATALFVDKPDEIKRIEIKERFYPFGDKTMAEIAIIINSDMTSKYNKVLWANFDQVFEELESEQEEMKLYLYDMPMLKIKELVKAKVAQIIAESESSVPKFDMAGIEDDPNDDPNDTEDDAAL